MSSTRDYLAAFMAASVIALVVDAVLQLSLAAIRVTGYGGGTPWWITAHLVERGRWVAFGALMWWLAPRLADGHQGGAEGTGGRAHAWRLVGTAVVTIPLFWVLATWVVSSIRFTLLGSWTTDGRVFLAPEYYRGVLVDYVPWLMAGLTLLGVRKHLD